MIQDFLSKNQNKSFLIFTNLEYSLLRIDFKYTRKKMCVSRIEERKSKFEYFEYYNNTRTFATLSYHPPYPNHPPSCP